MNHKHFVGTGHWVDQLPEQIPGVETTVQRFFTDQMTGVLRDGSELVLDCTFRSKTYTAQLVRDGSGNFTGTFSASENGRTWHGPVAGRLFDGASGVFFYGTWAPDSGVGKRTFWADLPVDHSRPNRFVDDGTEFITIAPPQNSSSWVQPSSQSPQSRLNSSHASSADDAAGG